jgi:hypothetical protein
MAKQGQHHNDARDSDESRGHNNPAKSMTITAGTPKKQETYERQARAHEQTDKQAQAQKNGWEQNTHHENRNPDGSLLGPRGLRQREGSDSNDS